MRAYVVLSTWRVTSNEHHFKKSKAKTHIYIDWNQKNNEPILLKITILVYWMVLSWVNLAGEFAWSWKSLPDFSKFNMPLCLGKLITVCSGSLQQFTWYLPLDVLGASRLWAKVLSNNLAPFWPKKQQNPVIVPLYVGLWKLRTSFAIQPLHMFSGLDLLVEKCDRPQLSNSYWRQLLWSWCHSLDTQKQFINRSRHSNGIKIRYFENAVTHGGYLGIHGKVHDGEYVEIGFPQTDDKIPQKIKNRSWLSVHFLCGDFDPRWIKY